MYYIEEENYLTISNEDQEKPPKGVLFIVQI
jgi:hypothetical protein